jgi:hypothetical protein
MLSVEARAVYRRLLALGLLVACLIVFTTSPATRKVLAAGCIQDCEANEAQCWDDCADACSTSDPSCSSCLQTCNDNFRRCMRMAIWCDDGPIVNERCTVNFGYHCEDWDDTCSFPIHQGYSEICPGLGSTHCWHCPPGEICEGTDAMGNTIRGQDGQCHLD